MRIMISLLFFCSLRIIAEPLFEEYIAQYQNPQFFEHNEESLLGRIQLLEKAPPGSTVKIATFVFDNGYATKLLAQHLCHAASPFGPKKMDITLLANSNTGCRPGVDDCFDKSDDIQINEEIYQYLANCGVKIYIHNVIPDNFYLVGKFSKNRYPILKEKDDIFFLEIMKNYQNILKDFQKSFHQHFSAIPGLTPNTVVDIQWPFNTKNIISLGRNLYKGKDLKIWDWLKTTNIGYGQPKHIKDRIPHFVHEIYNHHPILSKALKRIQILNRINHRKLFLVQTPDQTSGCFFIGGRNLGDHYLTWSKKGSEFIDGDIFFCGESKDSGSNLEPINQAFASFQELLENTKDPVMDNILYLVKPDFEYPFRLLSFPMQEWSFFSPKMIEKPRRSKTLTQEDRMLPPLVYGAVKKPIKGIELSRTYDLKVRRSSWDQDQDEIWKDLMAGIKREQELVYLETAYGEFHEDIRQALESALTRGVTVHIVTNSFLLLDGPSKAIRIMMAPWIKDMSQKFGSKFIYEVATVHGGHMIHFKAFGFRKQKKSSGYFKFFGVGSHNFHPRSGLFDKEHAVHWKEKISEENDLYEDFIHIRKNYYDRLSSKNGSFLKRYSSLYEELQDELSYIKKRDPKLYRLGKGIKKTFFNSEGMIKDGEDGLMILKNLRDSGLQDLLGIFL